MIGLDRNRAVTHVLTEPQIGIAMSFVSRFSGFCVELRPILKNFLLQRRKPAEGRVHLENTKERL